MLSSNMLLPNLIPLIDVTFSTPTGDSISLRCFSPLPDWDLSYPWACGSPTWMKVALLGFIDSKRDVLLSGPMPFVKTRGGGVDDRENRTTSIARVNAGD